MELAYDPGTFSSVKIAPGSFFQNAEVLLNKVNERNGRISYAIAPSKGQDNLTGSNVVATIQVTPQLNPFKRETTLYFLPKTVVRTQDSPNTLKIAYGTSISITARGTQFASPSADFNNEVN
jgi:hypothetical protein